MKSLDEHIQDAVQDWHKQMAPTLSSAANVAAPATKASSVVTIIVSTLSVVAIATVAWLVFVPASEPVAPQRSQMSTPSVADSEEVEISEPVPHVESSPNEVVEKESSRSTEAMEDERSQDSGSLVATSTVDGFTVEYERLLQRAMSFESSNPLRAASEYRGIGRLCIQRKQYAHAVAPLEQSIRIAKANSFQDLAASSTALLEQVTKELRR